MNNVISHYITCDIWFHLNDLFHSLESHCMLCKCTKYSLKNDFSKLRVNMCGYTLGMIISLIVRKHLYI